MSLSLSKLERSLFRIYNNPGDIRSAEQAERLWADAYIDYAMDAVDVSGDSLASANPIGFRQPLRFRRSRNERTFSRQIANAFRAYWTGAVFSVGTPPGPAAQCPSVGGNGIFGTELASNVITVNATVMSRRLAPALLRFNRRTTARQKARDIARAMHQATTTGVLVLITGLDTTPSPGGPLPITNTCTIS